VALAVKGVKAIRFKGQTAHAAAFPK